MPRTSPAKIDGRPPETRKRDIPANAFKAASVDILYWTHPWLPWRLRFRPPIEIEPNLPPANAQARAEEIATALRTHCDGTTRRGTLGLYLERDADVARLMELYGRFIVRLQHKTQYDAARDLAERLGGANPGTDR